MPASKSRAAPKRTRKPSPQRLRKLLATEWGYWDRGMIRIAGVDEVGRGPLAGPVVAAAVILPESTWIDGVDDSKRLNAGRRTDLYQKIVQSALVFGIGAASAREIDRINIRRATALAMQRAIARLGGVDHLLVDGLAVPELGTETHTAIVGGDGWVHCISAASIIAKVTRDRLMARLAGRYPEYGWSRNMGYGTPEHLRALDRLGPTPHHRRSFQPCQLDFAEALLDAEAGDTLLDAASDDALLDPEAVDALAAEAGEMLLVDAEAGD
ncbi:MAG TPA: ribonuclease HII [Longimicrobium sp.]|nr:ribonuclease HII [Longimicrobium sp.]